MRKFLSLVLAALMVFSMAVVASAEDTTTLTTNVPAATYALNIPADQEVPFGATEVDIGFASVTNASGFAEGKNLKVTITYTPFACENVSTTIPYTLTIRDDISSKYALTLQSGDSVVFNGKADGTVQTEVYLGKYLVTGNPTYDQHLYAECGILNFNSTDWGKALGGEYTATITFTAEVVVED